MPDLTGLWQALQALGIAGLLLLQAWLVYRGVYVTGPAHAETVAALNRTIATLEREVARLTELAARHEWRGDD